MAHQANNVKNIT